MAEYIELINKLRQEAEWEAYLQPHSQYETPKLLAKAADVIEKLSEERKKGEWINIESKLPPEGEECLIYDGDAIYVWELRRDRQTNELFFEDKYGYDQDVEDVEYWMPLPELPQENNLHYISGMSPT